MRMCVFEGGGIYLLTNESECVFVTAAFARDGYGHFRGTRLQTFTGE